MSRPTRARGLERLRRRRHQRPAGRAPRGRVDWNCSNRESSASIETSRPTRARGLEPLPAGQLVVVGLVAPHAGAWIGTQTLCLSTTCPLVAPHAGAWIGTLTPCMSWALWWVAPHAGAWIGTWTPSQIASTPRSRPTRARGLEHGRTHVARRRLRRAPRGRVDWNPPQSCRGWTPQVAPHAGAWIGTRPSRHHPSVREGRAPRGRVDWNADTDEVVVGFTRRAPRGRVDWNTCTVFAVLRRPRRAPRGRVDWNPSGVLAIKAISASRPTRARGLELRSPPARRHLEWSRPTRARGLEQHRVDDPVDLRLRRAPRGRVDWNQLADLCRVARLVAPHAGA